MKMNEYVAGLSKKKLENLVLQFADMLIEQEMINYIDGGEDDDGTTYEIGFSCAHTGKNY